MEELHRIHKDVPFGYWVAWVEPALRALARRGKDRRGGKRPSADLSRLPTPR